jgi:cytochrome c peroxidase
VVEFYDKGGGANPHRDAVLQPLNLSAEEKRSLVAFLKSL